MSATSGRPDPTDGGPTRRARTGCIVVPGILAALASGPFAFFYAQFAASLDELSWSFVAATFAVPIVLASGGAWVLVRVFRF